MSVGEAGNSNGRVDRASGGLMALGRRGGVVATPRLSEGRQKEHHMQGGHLQSWLQGAEQRGASWVSEICA